MTLNAYSRTKRLLIVDADQKSAKLLCDELFAEGYETAQAACGAEAITLAIPWQPALIILDTSLPDFNGGELIRVLREQSPAAIIAISDRDQESEKIAALDLGANDFICKPIKLGELAARLRSALRTHVSFVPPVSHVYKVGHLAIDGASRTATMRGQVLRLTFKEFQVLHILAAANGRVVTQDRLIQLVWSPKSADSHQYLRAFIARLRRKIENNPAKPKLLLTDHGVGFRLVPGRRVDTG
jgi:two-component system KDP operon response regulator KdpE